MTKSQTKVNNFGERELQRAQEQFDKFDKQVKELNVDELNKAPLEEGEPQTKLSSSEVNKSQEIWLKPIKSFPPGQHPKTGKWETFNEKYRKEWEYDKEYVRFIAENLEIIGESIDTWTKPYPGIPCEEWIVPTNKPVYGPRYLAEQIKRKRYHVLRMEDHAVAGSDYAGTYVGSIVAKQTKQRLDAHKAPETQISFHKKVSNF